jgi:hypothetical protein
VAGRRYVAAFGLIVALGTPGAVAQSQQPGPARPSRDTPAQKAGAAAPSGTIVGRVLTADSGRPVVRARVFITAADLPQGRGVLTDNSGGFQFTELPAGRYTVTASKTGFISLS